MKFQNVHIAFCKSHDLPDHCVSECHQRVMFLYAVTCFAVLNGNLGGISVLVHVVYLTGTNFMHLTMNISMFFKDVFKP